MKTAGIGGRTSAMLVNNWLVTWGDWASFEARIEAALKL